MPYVERVTKAGNTIEIERYFTSRYKKKGISRGDKVKPTKEEQEKVNTRQAERKLRILINANYGYGDYHLVLDYIRRKGEPDRTPEQMRQDIDVFLRECRKEYRKAGLEFKYIHVMEIGKKGARHHHLVVNKIDTEILQRWLEYLRQQGYYTAVCYGWQPAAQLIEQYLLHSDELTKEQETVTMR